MTQRVVVLGCGRRVTLGNYVKAWRACLEFAKANPDGQVRGRPSYSRDWGSAAEVLREFREGMHDRINRHAPGYGVGRKWDSAWYWETWRASRDLNRPRLVIDWLPQHLAGRFAHRLRRNMGEF